MRKGKKRTQVPEEKSRDVCSWDCSALHIALEASNGTMWDPILGKYSPNWSGEALWIVRQTMAFPTSRAVGILLQHWYTAFATSAGTNLMAIPTFSKGRLLGTLTRVEDVMLTSGRRTSTSDLDTVDKGEVRVSSHLSSSTCPRAPTARSTRPSWVRS